VTEPPPQSPTESPAQSPAQSQAGTPGPRTRVHWPRPDDRDVDVLPKEAREFQGHRAGIVSRCLANTIDFVLVQVVVVSLFVGWMALLFLVNPTSFSVPSPSFALWLLATGLLLVGYFLVAWVTTGRTYGDHILGLRVVGVRGTRMRPLWALLRALFCVVFPIGLFWAVVSRENRSVQDTLMRTSVIYDWVTIHATQPSGHPSNGEAGAPDPTAR